MNKAYDLEDTNYNTENVEVKKEKSRHLPIYEFFRILQLEAIVADLRSKIYPKTKDKDFWKKVYENKKNTVLDIASRNKVNNLPLPSIFTDDEILEEYKREVYGDGGFPKFIYKNEEQKYQQGYFDCINYYAKNADVACKYFNEIKIGNVKYYQNGSKNVSVIIDGKDFNLPITDVTRIL